MTSISVDRRVLVDWDGDGFMNEGVLQSTPPNLFPSQLYATGSFLRGWNTAFTTSYYTDEPDPSTRGIMKRGVRMGDQAMSIRAFLDAYLPYQPQVGDPVNLLTGSKDYDFGSYEYMADFVTGYGTVLQPRVVDPPFDNGLIGEVAAVLPLGSLNRNAYVLGISATNGGSAHKYRLNGFDGTTLYSNALNGASTGVTWGGFPAIVPGQTYTFIVNIGTTAADKISPAGSTDSYQIRLYGNGGISTTPNFGRQYLGGVAGNTFLLNGWRTERIVFTAPVGATQMAFDFQTNQPVNRVYIGGMMLFNGNVALPTRFWDTRAAYRAQQFSYSFPGDSQPYVLSFWVRSPNGISKLIPTRHVTTIGAATTTSTLLSDITVTSDWQRVNFAIAASASERGVWYTFTAEKGGLAVGALNAGDVEFSGFMITEGSVTGYPYHAGTLYGYDDITNLVLSVSTKNGKSDFNAALPDEGTVELQMDNSDQRFSPRNTESPLYGYLEQNLKIKIQIQDPTTDEWLDIWSGWTASFDVTPGTTSSQQAVINGRQGLYRLEEGSLSVPIVRDTTMDVLARKIIEGSGWRSTANVLQSFVGLRTLVGENAYTMDRDLIYEAVDEGVNTIEVSGRDWSQETDPRKALEDVLAAENAAMWINRDGSVRIVNRNYYITDAVDDTIVLDTNVNSAAYTYGQDIINSVDVTVTKNKLIADQPVWATKRPVHVRPNQRWVVDLNPEYTEGKTKTVIEYTLEGITKTVYLKDTSLTGEDEELAKAEQADRVKIELLGDAGERPQIRVTNNNPIEMWVDLEVKGSYLDTGDSIIVKVKDEASIERLQGRHTETYSNPVINDERYAASYGEFLMLRQSQALGEFKSFSITVSDLTDLNRVLNLSLGSLVVLSEAQSSEVEQYHVIIGEDFSITNSETLTVTYYLARSLQEQFAKADVTLANDATVNMIPDMANAAPTNGGTYKFNPRKNLGLPDVYTWDMGLGNVNKLVLNPSREQLKVFQPGELGVTQWPLTDEVGTAYTPAGNIRHYQSVPVMPFSTYWMLPKGFEYIMWLVRADAPNPFTSPPPPTNFSVTRAYSFAVRNKTTAVTVGVAERVDPLYGVLPDAKYKMLTEYVFGTSQAATSGASGSAVPPFAYQLADWTGIAPQSGSTITGASVAQITSEMNFRVRDYITGATFGAVGFSFYSSFYGYDVAGIVNMALLRYSDHGRMGGVFLNTAQSHKYTLFANTEYDSVPVSYTLTVIAEDGSTIGTDAHTIAHGSPTKFEVNIPSGNTSAWAYLQKTTQDYRETKVNIYAYGITASAVSSYTDLLVADSQELVYA